MNAVAGSIVLVNCFSNILLANKLCNSNVFMANFDAYSNIFSASKD